MTVWPRLGIDAPTAPARFGCLPGPRDEISVGGPLPRKRPQRGGELGPAWSRRTRVYWDTQLTNPDRRKLFPAISGLF
jgi:hypothetical protein